MKNIIFSVILILGITSSLFSQTIVQKWNTNFTWNGQNDEPTKIVLNNNSIFVNGSKSAEVGSARSAIAKFSSLSGDTLWKKVDTTKLSYSGLQFCISGEKIFYLSQSLSNAYFYLIIRNKNTGEMLRIKPLGARMSFCEYGDSVIAVTCNSSSRVIIMNNAGDSIRSFPLGYSLSNGFVAVKRNRNYVWIFGLYYSGGYSSFVEKRNILSGELMWRRNFQGSGSIRGEVDSLGNCYPAKWIGPTSYISKIDSANNVVWQKPQSFQGNPVAFTDITISKNMVIGGGNATENGKTVGYVSGVDINNGDSLFMFTVKWNQNANSNSIMGICADSSGNFYITGDDFTGSGPITCHVRKYYYDTLTGIIVINETPEVFSLSQNYPNPFNPTTKINFSIPKQGFVTLKVYDMLGKEVATLVNETKFAGNYSVDFNGSNLPSGTYFYRIETDDFSDVKKMILVK